jgi:hypothetical protein
MDTLLQTYPGLTHNGHPCRWEGYQAFKPARIEFFRSVIRKTIVPARCFNVGSYSGKHYVEKLTDSYMTNGEFIVAMMLEGYTSSKVVAGSPNVSFKAKYLADREIVANFPHQCGDLPEVVLGHRWGKKKLANYRTIVAEVEAYVKEVKGDKECVEDVIGRD